MLQSESARATTVSNGPKWLHRLFTAAVVLVCAGAITRIVSNCSEAVAENRGDAASSLPALSLTYHVDPGVWTTHDLSVTNTCGRDLSEVHLSVTFVGENASPTVKRYWMTWPLGERRDIAVDVDDVRNVQQVIIKGRASEGLIEETLTRR